MANQYRVQVDRQDGLSWQDYSLDLSQGKAVTLVEHLREREKEMGQDWVYQIVEVEKNDKLA